MAREWTQLSTGETENAVLQAIEETGQLLVQEIQARITRQLWVSTTPDYKDKAGVPETWAEAHELAHFVKVFMHNGEIVVGIPPGIRYKGVDASDLAFRLDYGYDPAHPAAAILKGVLRDMEYRLDQVFKDKLRMKMIQMRGQGALSPR